VLVDTETGALVEFNDRAYENLGHTREEFQKLKIPDFEIIESAEEVAKHIEKIILKMVLSDADETTREYLDIISSEVRNSTKIVSDLLDFARTRPAREKRLWSELVAQTLEKQPLPEEVQVTTEIAPDLPPVFVDPRQIGHVLGNLVINAYQAMPEGGDLTISARAEEDKVTLSITDTGCRISPENIGKLFEPLFTTKARGIGLGLAVSKNLVEANGGGIEVESQEGQGSTFTVILPVKEAMS
jgi:signal transduction histidine kinase